MVIHAVLVFLGGFFGVLARYALSLILPNSWEPFPIATACVNICGSFLLGALAAFLVRAVTDQTRRSRVRHCLGTGFLGSFTTYSALVVEPLTHSSALRGTHDNALAVGVLVTVTLYVALSVGLGLVAAWCGLLVGTHIPLFPCGCFCGRFSRRHVSRYVALKDNISTDCVLGDASDRAAAYRGDPSCNPAYQAPHNHISIKKTDWHGSHPQGTKKEEK